MKRSALFKSVRFKIADLAILGRIPHLDRMAANFAILYVGLAWH